jgi:hypothetical protein
VASVCDVRDVGDASNVSKAVDVRDVGDVGNMAGRLLRSTCKSERLKNAWMLWDVRKKGYQPVFGLWPLGSGLRPLPSCWKCLEVTGGQ